MNPMHAILVAAAITVPDPEPSQATSASPCRQGGVEMTPSGAGHPISEYFARRVTNADSKAAAGGRTTENRGMNGATQGRDHRRRADRLTI
jgi:hypothetical protein